VRFVLGDTSYNDPALHVLCATQDRILVTPHRARRRKQDEPGRPVRKVLHELRSRAIENFNGQFKGIFGLGGQVPTRGLVATQRYVLGAILVYQLTLLLRAQADLPLRVGLKPFLRAA
jgi:hypothetical protein